MINELYCRNWEVCKFSLKLVGMMLVAVIFVHIVILLGTLNFNMMGRLRMKEGKNS
jgi:hypothetical protein